MKHANSIRIVCVILLGLLNCPGILAQNAQNVVVIPSSPASASFERYGDYPVSMFAGVPEINIPIYEIVSGDLKIPISISYHASGIKMADNSYPVGLGWTLNGPGRISRTVRGRPDDMSTSMAAFVTSQLPTQYEASVAMTTMDSEPDLFFYNLGVKGAPTGRFFFDGLTRLQNNNQLVNPIFLPFHNVKFSHNAQAGEMSLIDAEGRKYKFGSTKEEYLGSPAYQGGYYSAWLLSEVLPANNQQSDKITLNYVAGPQLTTCSYEGSLTIIDSIAFGSGNSMNNFFAHFDYLYGLGDPSAGYTYNPSAQFKRLTDNGSALTYVSNVTQANKVQFYQQECHSYKTSVISAISFKGGRVDFVYDVANTMLGNVKVYDSNNQLILTAGFFYSNYSGESRVRLDSLIIAGGNAADKKKYSFNYEGGAGNVQDQLSKDFWGYYNGIADNGITTPVPRWTDIRTVGLVQWNTSGANFTYLDTDIGTGERGASSELMKKYVLNKISYPTGGTTEFEFEINQYLDPALQELKDVGGLRVKRISNKDNSGNILRKKFLYGINNDGAGIPRNIPSYEDYVSERHMVYDHLLNVCGPSLEYCFPLALDKVYARRRDFLSSPNKEIMFVDGSAVWYTHVEEFLEDNNGQVLGKTVYEYDLPEENEEAYHYDNNGKRLDTKYTLVMRGLNFPDLRETTFYKSTTPGNYEKVRSSSYEYSINSSGGIGYTYPFFKYLSYNEGVPNPAQWDQLYNPNNYYENYQPIIFVSAEIHSRNSILIKEISTTYAANGTSLLGPLIETQEYEYNAAAHEFPIAVRTYSSNGDYSVKRMKYPLDFPNLSAQDDLTQGINNLKNLNYVAVPIEQITEVYNPAHVKKGATAATFTTYKADKPFADKVYALETNAPSETFNGTSIVNGAIVPDPLFKLQQQVDSYNAEGDVLEQHVVGNNYISYVWGYNNAYPIAEVVNARQNGIFHTSFEDAEGNSSVNDSKTGRKSRVGGYTKLLSGLINGDYVLSYWQKTGGNWVLQTTRITTSGNYTINLSGQVDEVRFYPVDAQMTTYTYDPLIGMTSQCDANNRITYYEYDNLGRLSIVRDQDRNVIKKMEYKYQSQ